MHMRAMILAGAALTAMAGCDGLATLPIGGAPAEEPIAPMPTVPAPTDITAVTADALPQVVLTGPALDLDWRQRYVANVPYVNTTDGTIDVFSGPDGRDVLARLAPGNGGAIDACAVEVEMCSITFGEPRQRGWVMMSNMAPQAAG